MSEARQEASRAAGVLRLGPQHEARRDLVRGRGTFALTLAVADEMEIWIQVNSFVFRPNVDAECASRMRSVVRLRGSC